MRLLIASSMIVPALALVMTGCSPSGGGGSDPAAGGTGGGGVLADAGAGGTGGGETGGTGGVGGDTGGGGSVVGGTGGGEVGGGDGGGGVGGGAPGACPEEITYLGQVFGAGSPAPDGGNAVFEPYAADWDGNISAVKAVFPAEGEPVDLETPVHLDNVLVTATSFRNENHAVPASQTTFWVTDAVGGTIEFRMSFEDAEVIPPFDIRVGHKVSMDVIQVGQYFGSGQVVRAINWELGSVDNDVYILEPGDTVLDPVAMPNQLVRVTGVLEGDGVPCGGSSTCWNEFNYGPGTGIFRTASNFAAPGACVTFVGPMRSYQDQVQFDTTNFDWMRVYD